MNPSAPPAHVWIQFVHGLHKAVATRTALHEGHQPEDKHLDAMKSHGWKFDEALDCSAALETDEPTMSAGDIWEIELDQLGTSASKIELKALLARAPDRQHPAFLYLAEHLAECQVAVSVC